MLGSMTETSKITGSPVNQIRQGSGIYREAREAERQSAGAQSSDSPQVKVAVTRLGRFIGSGREFRTDVPRGFYFNVRI